MSCARNSIIELIKDVVTEIKSKMEGTPPHGKIEKKKVTACKANTYDLYIQLSVPSCVYTCSPDAVTSVDLQCFFGDPLLPQDELIRSTRSPARRYKTHYTD
jgi:hypothetical protein